jgi:hypothetical protein
VFADSTPHLVLNISNCGLKALPKNLKGLKKLKALVAMNNDWESLDDDVVSAWPELNSLSEWRVAWRLAGSISHLRDSTPRLTTPRLHGFMT